MKLTTTFFTLSLALTAISTPLGDRAVFRRHTGVPANNARRYILQSRMDAPPACIAKASSANPTDLPDLSNSTVVDPSATDIPTNSTDDTSVPNIDNSDNSTDTTDTTDTTNTDVPDDTSADNSTSVDASNSTDAGARRRRGLNARFAQLDIFDLAVEWQTLCLHSGGAGVFTEHSPCVEFAGLGGINALLVDADPCAQQVIADSMITFAKSSGIVNRGALIAFALKYRRHPRNAVNILGVVPSTLYCLDAPTNPELVGVWNGQLDGVNPGLFGSPNSPMVPFGAQGTCPLGTTPDVSTCSCVPDTTGRSDLNPPSDGSVDNSTVSDASVTDSVDNPTATATDSVDDPTATATDAATPTDSAIATDSAATDAPAPTDSATDSSDPNASAAADDAAATPAATDSTTPSSTIKVDGLNAQPTDISGDVNDPNGRRK